jgi:NAD(P)-dependent dehydrogenase (short-subunit alcohol dehydrogenase family)
LKYKLSLMLIGTLDALDLFSFPVSVVVLFVITAGFVLLTSATKQKHDPLYDLLLREQWGGPTPKHFLKAWREWPQKHGSDCEGKVALVTGSTGGVGFFVAKLLAQIGYVVVVPARSGFEDEARASKDAILAAVPNATVIVPSEPLDLQSFASVRRFVAALAVSPLDLNRLDLLCLNAGIGGSAGDARVETEDGLEAIMQVNAISHLLLTTELLPLLMAAPAARIISQTSRQRLCKAPGFSASMRDRKLADLCAERPTQAGPYNGFHQYQLSKACLCFLTRALNARLERAGVDSVVALVCEPGFAATGVNAQHNLAHSLFGLPRWLAPAWLTTRLLHATGCHASDGALPMVMAATAPQRSLRRNDWFTPKWRLAGEPILGDPTTHGDAHLDPLNVEASNWPERSLELVWEQAVRWTGLPAAVRALFNT